jgi:RND family efflux transporter MFP subunit
MMAKLGGYVKEIRKLKNEATGELEEIDIGSRVKAGDVLAVLYVPEMIQELSEKESLLAQAARQVEQVDAAIAQAKAEVARREAELAQSKTLIAEKQAAIAFYDVEKRKYEELVRDSAARRDLLDAAVFKLAAAQAALASADASVKTAEANLAAAKAGVVKAEADKKSAQANHAVAQASRQRVQTLLDYAEIKAPYDGVITNRWIDHGDFVQPATNNSAAQPLFEITRYDRVRIAASVPMIPAAKVDRDKPAVFQNIGGLPGVRVAGKITHTTEVLGQESRALKIEVHLDNPVEDEASGREIELKPGQIGILTLTLRTWNDLPVVPASAVAKDEKGSYVMMVEGGRCQKQYVEVVFNNSDDAGVEGIPLGCQVATTGVAGLKDGEVNVVN